MRDSEGAPRNQLAPVREGMSAAPPPKASKFAAFTSKLQAKKRESKDAATIAGAAAAAAAEPTLSPILDYSSADARWRFYQSPMLLPAMQQQLSIGRLEVNVIEAVHVPAADLGGTSDPYLRLTVTGRNKFGEEWDAALRQSWCTKVVKRDLNPMFHEETRFHIFRHDAILRVEVWDEDVGSKDDLLGSVEIPLADLVQRGLLKRWWDVTLEAGFGDAPTALHLHLKYDVSALGEAASYTWAEQPRKRVFPKFDVNTLIANGKEFAQELKPYQNLALSFLKAASWKDNGHSRKWLSIGLFVGVFIDRFWAIFHFGLFVLLLANLRQKRLTEKVKAGIAAVFLKIDTDGGGSLDRHEIGVALRDMSKAQQKPQPSEEDVDAMFARADADKGGTISLEEFSTMCLESPIFTDKPPKALVEDTDVIEEEDELLEDLVEPVSVRKPRGPSVSISFRKKEDAALKEESKGPVKGIARKMINLAGRKAGPMPAFGSRQLGSLAKDIRFVRSIFEWDNFKISAAVSALNFVAAVAHCLLPLNFFAVPAVIGVFFALTQKLKALQRIGAKGPAALKRYRRMIARRDADEAALGTTKRPNAMERIKSMTPFCQNACYSSKNLRAVTQAIFTRLDQDGSGGIDAEELAAFFVDALPNATPAARDSVGGSVHAVLKKVKALVAKYDVSGDGVIDFDEFTQIVALSGCAAVLIQDELSRQLADGGVKCLKLAQSKGKFGLSPGSALRSHPTSVVVFDALRKEGAETTPLLQLPRASLGLRYTKRDATPVEILAETVTRVYPDAYEKGWVRIECGDKAVLSFSVASVLRDALVDLLSAIFVKDADGPPPPPLESPDSVDSPLELRTPVPRRGRSLTVPRPSILTRTTKSR
ncbi:hypothetical protein M885DRAFT_491192 [Pelagophyceae sp. CCMP2097]|nr:hypothetical protein M885DRAFT_491192 [Pelagophyceae sp. CCMP2097]